MIGRRINRKTSALLERNMLGETFISFTALEQLTERALKDRDEVKSSKIKIYAIGNSVWIDVRAVTPPTVSLITITHALESEIGALILAACGTAVGKVDVTIDQTDITPKRK